MPSSGPLGPHRSTPLELKARLDAERGDSPFLVLRDAAGAQRIEALKADRELSIGRDGSADVSLEWDGNVSRLHATLRRVGGSWTISDDGLSRNGTFIGRDRVQGRRRLSDGDPIRVGDTVLVFCDPAAGEQGETTRAEGIRFEYELSKLQRAVLVALCRPLQTSAAPSAATNQEIADEVHLSVAAVKTHLRTLFAKFDLTDLEQNRKRAALAEAALQSGAVSALDFRSD